MRPDACARTTGRKTARRSAISCLAARCTDVSKPVAQSAPDLCAKCETTLPDGECRATKAEPHPGQVQPHLRPLSTWRGSYSRPSRRPNGTWSELVDIQQEGKAKASSLLLHHLVESLIDMLSIVHTTLRLVVLRLQPSRPREPRLAS